jgi:molybdopterin-synthase adenylyltransferase
MIAYEELVLRNQGYIGAELQARIRKTRLLIAGCGVGSTVAETAIRTGFETITLADADSALPRAV